MVSDIRRSKQSKWINGNGIGLKRPTERAGERTNKWNGTKQKPEKAIINITNSFFFSFRRSNAIFRGEKNGGKNFHNNNYNHSNFFAIIGALRTLMAFQLSSVGCLRAACVCIDIILVLFVHRWQKIGYFNLRVPMMIYNVFPPFLQSINVGHLPIKPQYIFFYRFLTNHCAYPISIPRLRWTYKR